LQVHGDGSARDTCLRLSASGEEHHMLAGSSAAEVLDRALSAWGDRLPGSPTALWAWCLDQDQDTLLRLLAYGMAQTVDAVQLKSDDPESERFAHADALEKALGIDMRSCFTPTAENYFGRVSKAGIIEALKEARGTVAPAWEKAKKSDLAAIAEREIAGTGWLPAPLKRAA
jgi:ParB family chromosome partitioning protein